MPVPKPSEAEASVTFGRVLDQALNSGQVREALDRSGGRLNREQLRTQVLQARAAIAATAAVEYRDYLEARAAATRQGGQRDTTDTAGVGTRGGGGLLPVLAVLVPSLSAASAAVFLLIGFGLRAFAGRPYLGEGLITAGVIAAAVTVGAALGDLAWLLVTAARNRSDSDGEWSAGDEGPEVRRAREAWQLALLERGMVPFLLGRLEEARAEERGGRPAR